MSNTEPVAESHPPSVVFSALADARRRYVLRHLADRKRPVSVSRLARRFAASESDVDPKEIHADLYHTHVPKLVDTGFVTHDERDDTIELAEGWEVLEPYLMLAERYESARSLDE